MKPARGSLALCAALAVLLAFATQGCWRRETLVEQGNREQILHRGIGQELADLDPQLATQASDYNVLSALFEGLVSEDPMDLHPVPGVAERWEVSADGLVYTFHLRATARWSNGEAVTAEDFVASYRRVLTPSLGSENAAQLHVVSGAEAFHLGRNADFGSVGFKAVDARTLRITLARPTPYFLAMLNQCVWLPVHLPTLAKQGPVDRRGNRWARPGTFVGNGPFNLREWHIGHRIVAERSGTYWDAAQVRLREIHFHPLDVESEERAFRSGQLHLTEALPPGKVDAYRADKSGVLRIDPLLGTYFYRINTRQPALGDPRVRRALGLAIDRRAIVERILRGGQLPAAAFTPPGTAGYEPPAAMPFDPEAARRLLVEAGFPGARGLPAVEILFSSSDTHRQIAEAVQEMWRRELGLPSKLVNMEVTSVLSARRSGDFQVLRSSWTGDYADPQNFLGIWTTDNGNNFTGWSDPAYDALLAQASETADNAARFALLQRAEQRLLEAAPCLPLYTYTHVFLLKPSVRGWHPTLLDHHPYKQVWLESAALQPAPAAAATRSGPSLLRISQRNEPGDLDPARASIPDEFFILRALSEGLVAPSPDGPDVVPAAAERWERSSNGRQYTFHLRPAGRWSNGDPVTAGDFVESYRRILDPATASPKAGLFAPVAGALEYRSGELRDFSKVGIQALDALTLVITLSKPSERFLGYAASGPWLPSHPPTIARHGRAWTRPGNFVGNGPYTLAEWRPHQRIVARRSESYWDRASVKAAELQFLAYDNSEAEERAFRAGQLDITMSVPLTKLSGYAALSPSPLRQAPLHELRYLSFNTRRPPLDDARIRRALGLALDRAMLTRHVLAGGQKPATRFLHPGFGVPSPAVEARWDPPLARRELAEAGYSQGRGFPKFELSGWASTPVLEAIQAMWRKELGIEVSLLTRDAKVHVAALQEGRYDIGFITAIPDTDDPALLLTELLPGAAGNFPQWDDDEYGALVAAGQWERAEARLLLQSPLSPLYFNTRNYLVRPGVAGWREDGLWNRFYKGVSP